MQQVLQNLVSSLAYSLSPLYLRSVAPNGAEQSRWQNRAHREPICEMFVRLNSKGVQPTYSKFCATGSHIPNGKTRAYIDPNSNH